MGWFRWHEGTVEDAKFAAISHDTGISVAAVTGVWAALLEDASSEKHPGSVTRSIELMALTLRVTVTELHKVLDGMERYQCIHREDDLIEIINWKKRQFSDASAAERMRRYRDRRKTGNAVGRPSKGVTDYRNGSQQITGTDQIRTDQIRTDQRDARERANGHADLDGDLAEAFDLFWEEYPEKVGKPAAKRAFPRALKSAGSIVVILEGLRRYKSRKPPDRSWLNPATFLNQERWNDRPAPAPVAPIGGGRGL